MAQKTKALCGWLQTRATEIEAARRIPEDVVERLAAAGLFRMMQPPLFGGLGCTPREAWEAVFEVGRGCGSCAWIVGLNSANILMLGKFSGQAQRDVFLCGKPAIVSMLTGGVGSGITVERASGGVMVGGRWRYASGIDVASWAGLLVPLPDRNGGAPEPHVVLVPQDAFSIDHSSWNVLGMRGTGSKDISLKPTFVPDHRWMSWSQLQAGEKHPTCPNREPIYDYPLNSIFAMSVLAPLLGVASAVAEEFREVAKTRVNSGTQQRQRDDKMAQIDVATGEATMAIVVRPCWTTQISCSTSSGGAVLSRRRNVERFECGWRWRHGLRWPPRRRCFQHWEAACCQPDPGQNVCSVICMP